MRASFPKIPRVFDARAVEVIPRIDQKRHAEELHQVLECLGTKASGPPWLFPTSASSLFVAKIGFTRVEANGELQTLVQLTVH